MQKIVREPLDRNKWIWFYHAVILIVVMLLLFDKLFRDDKIAYVDSGKIMTEFKGAEAAKKSYQAKAAVWQSNIDTLTKGIQESIKRYEKDLATMSAKEQNLSKQLIVTKQQELTNYQKAIQESARQEDSKLTQNVVSQINTFLVKYGKNHNYKMILIASQAGTIAYAREGLDITANVIEDLNKEYNPIEQK